MRALLRRWRESKKASVNTSNAEVSTLIASAVAGRVPFMAGRGGWMESYGAGVLESGWEPDHSLLAKLHRHAGIFPATTAQLRDFSRVYLRALASADLLGLLQSPYEGWLLARGGANAKRCALADLEPYLSPQPWSEHLRGLRVLVVHPFAHSIASQYAEKRTALFADSRILPEFALEVLKAPQTMCGTTGGYASWTAAFEDLCREVKQRSFDVALVGCGAYGLPLAAFVKNTLGKIAIHLGGATQMLFGVSGARWRNNPRFRKLINPSWCTPREDERPTGWEQIEGGCYW